MKQSIRSQTYRAIRPVCPYCGSASVAAGGGGTRKCDTCEEDFVYEISRETVYRTSCTEHDWNRWKAQDDGSPLMEMRSCKRCCKYDHRDTPKRNEATE